MRYISLPTLYERSQVLIWLPLDYRYQQVHGPIRHYRMPGITSSSTSAASRRITTFTHSRATTPLRQGVPTHKVCPGFRHHSCRGTPPQHDETARIGRAKQWTRLNGTPYFHHLFIKPEISTRTTCAVLFWRRELLPQISNSKY